MCQMLNTCESNNFYFGIFICIGPLMVEKMLLGVIGVGSICFQRQLFFATIKDVF